MRIGARKDVLNAVHVFDWVASELSRTNAMDNVVLLAFS